MLAPGLGRPRELCHTLDRLDDGAVHGRDPLPYGVEPTIRPASDRVAEFNSDLLERCRIEDRNRFRERSQGRSADAEPLADLLEGAGSRSPG